MVPSDKILHRSNGLPRWPPRSLPLRPQWLRPDSLASHLVLRTRQRPSRIKLHRPAPPAPQRTRLGTRRQLRRDIHHRMHLSRLGHCLPRVCRDGSPSPANLFRCPGRFTALPSAVDKISREEKTRPVGISGVDRQCFDGGVCGYYVGVLLLSDGGSCDWEFHEYYFLPLLVLNHAY